MARVQNGASSERSAMLLFLQAVFALAATLGLFGVGVYAARRWGPAGMFRLGAGARTRRLAVVETLSLDANRRLVLVRVDREERLLLLGEGQVLTGPMAQVQP